jgi:hypothetical protein
VLSFHRAPPVVLVLFTVALALAGCGDAAPSPSALIDPASSAPSPGASTTAGDLSAVACATDDPADVGELTGAWQGDDSGVYYIRQVGECVWWFGTELRDIEPGVTAQSGFANVATGRVDGTEIVVEWADVPMGNILNGGGLTLVYDKEADRLEITERRGDGQPFGATAFVRIESDASPDATPRASASP